jgi:hypothetical protein
LFVRLDQLGFFELGHVVRDRRLPRAHDSSGLSLDFGFWALPQYSDFTGGHGHALVSGACLGLSWGGTP